MSKKYPGRDTEYAKWKSVLAKLDYNMRKKREYQKKENKEGDIRKSKKRIKEREEVD